MGALYDSLGDYEQAEPLYREALEVSRKILGIEHPDTLLTVYHVASFLICHEQLVESESLAVECYEGNRAVYGESHTETTDAIDLLIVLYTTWHESDPTAGHDTQAAEWKAKLDALNAEPDSEAP